MVSLTLVGMFLLPMGLKLEHTLTLHSQSTNCKETKVHFHQKDDHNDFLDVFFQSLGDYSLTTILFSEKNNIGASPTKYLLNFYHSSFKSFRVRGPPL